MKTQEKQQGALSRAVNPIGSLTNYPAIFSGFMEKGIPEAEIQPRVNVFTYDAWRALGRQVRKGEHGVKVVTFITWTRREIDPNTDIETNVPFRRPWTTTVFHVTQTDPIRQ